VIRYSNIPDHQPLYNEVHIRKQAPVWHSHSLQKEAHRPTKVEEGRGSHSIQEEARIHLELLQQEPIQVPLPRNTRRQTTTIMDHRNFTELNFKDQIRVLAMLERIMGRQINPDSKKDRDCLLAEAIIYRRLFLKTVSCPPSPCRPDNSPCCSPSK